MTSTQKKYNKKHDWLSTFKRVQKIKNRLPVLRYLETHIVDHCNLNCKACSHYSPISPEHFVDVEKFKINLNILSKKLRFQSIRLLGGEPLLHPEINSFMEIARNAFPKSRIAIVTNGILLSKMPQSFWETCRKYNVSIDLSKYPYTEEIFQNSMDLINGKAVNLGYIHDSPKMYVFHNPKGDSSKELSFKYCALKKYTILRDNKIFTCPKKAYINLYNDFFRVKTPMDKGININFNSGKKIVKYLKKPALTCKFCTYGGRFVDWELSRKIRDDWNALDDLSLLPKFQEYMLKKIVEEDKNN